MEFTYDTILPHYVYQKVHVRDGTVPDLSLHTSILSDSFNKVYRTELPTDRAAIGEAVRNYCRRQKLYNGSVEITLQAAMDQYNGPRISICFTRRLLYKNYVLWHTGRTAVALDYDYPHHAISTSASLAAHELAAGTFAGTDTDCVIRLCAAAAVDNKTKYLLAAGCGDSNLLAVFGNDILSTGTRQTPRSAEESLALQGAQLAGYAFHFRDITPQMLSEADELFYIDTQGTVSIRNFSGRIMTATTARRIAAEMEALR